MALMQPLFPEFENVEAEIRIFELYPGELDDAISGRLHVATLSDRPTYTALSYVWGEPSKTFDIQLDSGVMGATSNLAAALRSLRDRNQIKPLWIDAICINQDDLSEKAVQVDLMGSVYANGSEVVIWLGEFDENWAEDLPKDEFCDFKLADSSNTERLRLALRTLSPPCPSGKSFTGESRLEHGIQLLTMLGHGTHGQDLPFFTITQNQGTNEPDITLKPQWYEAIKALRWLLSRPWWTRVWTMQEFVLATQPPIFRVGRRAIPSAIFEAAAIQFWWHVAQHKCCAIPATIWSGDLSSMALMFIRVFHLWSMRQRRERSPNGKMGAAEVLPACQGKAATDSRDYLYSVLGIIAEASSIHADYGRDYANVCCLSTKLLIASQPNDLWPAMAVGLKHASGPTWIYDMARVSQSRLQGGWDAAGTTRMDAGNILADLPSSSLQLRTTKVGKVQSIVPATETRNYDGIDGNAIIVKTIEAWLAMAEGTGQYDETRFSRTMFHDRLPWTMRADQGHDTGLDDRHIAEILGWWRHGQGKNIFDPNSSSGKATQTFAASSQPEAPQAPSEPPSKQPQNHLAYTLDFLQIISEFTFFVTESGDYGLGRHSMHAEDEVHVLEGCPLPVILRPGGGISDQKLAFVGPCYFDGWMYGRAVSEATVWHDIRII